MQGRYNPLNIDESKIVKKNKPIENSSIAPVVKEDVISSEIETPKIEPIQKQSNIEQPNIETVKEQIKIEQSIKENLNKTTQNKNQKVENYFKVINDYLDESGTIVRTQLPNRKETVNNMLKDTYQKPKIPVYKYSKDIKTGQINIESKKSEEVKNDDKKQTTNNQDDIDTIPKQEIKKLLDETNRNIIRTKIELRIHLELIRNHQNEANRNLYENKIKSFKDDLDYLNQRKIILEQMQNENR